jgi:hypothetical protein
MTDADSQALKSMKKAADGLIPAEVWETVEKQAAEVGVLGLTGTARAIVEGLVRKHGSPGDPGYANLHPSGAGASAAGSGGGSEESGGSGGGGGGSAGSPMSSKDRTKEGKKLRDNGEANVKQITDAGMRDVKVSSPNLPKGSKGTLLATGIDMGGGKKGAYVGFSKPVTFTDGDFSESSTVHLIDASEVS